MQDSLLISEEIKLKPICRTSAKDVQNFSGLNKLSPIDSIVKKNNELVVRKLVDCLMNHIKYNLNIFSCRVCSISEQLKFLDITMVESNFFTSETLICINKLKENVKCFYNIFKMNISILTFLKEVLFEEYFRSGYGVSPLTRLLHMLTELRYSLCNTVANLNSLGVNLGNTYNLVKLRGACLNPLNDDNFFYKKNVTYCLKQLAFLDNFLNNVAIRQLLSLEDDFKNKITNFSRIQNVYEK